MYGINVAILKTELVRKILFIYCNTQIIAKSVNIGEINEAAKTQMRALMKSRMSLNISLIYL